MARRWRQAPNWWWWHADTDYDDWLIAWLLERSKRWYLEAEAGFGTGDAHGRLDALMAQAELNRRLGRWAAAEYQFRQLLAEPAVAASPFARSNSGSKPSRFLACRIEHLPVAENTPRRC